MFRFIVARILSGLVVVFFVATFSFFIIRQAPGGPFSDERQLAPEIQKNIEEQFDMDKPLAVQYVRYMTKLAKGDMGPSFKRATTVNRLIKEHFGVSVKLGILSLVFSIIFGILLGVLAAAKQNTAVDHSLMAVSLLGISLPSFVLGPILILIFSLILGWLPPARIGGFSGYILPAATLGMIYMGVVARLARSGLLDTLRQDYIRTARAKGLSERKVVWKHAVRLGLLPVVTYIGPAVAALITGSFIVEKIFQVPGLGFYFVAAITDRDYTVISGLLVFYSVFLVFMNLLVDIAYGFVDPRIRTEG